MKHSIKFNLTGGVILLCLAMCLTSCEGALDDVLGEWSRPTPGNNTNNNTNTTPTTSSNYMEWDGSDLAAQAIPTTGIQEVTDATTSFEGGFYIVKKDVTITTDVLINGDTKLILCDGVTLKVTGRFEDTSGNTNSLTIYGQENQTGKLIVNAPAGNCGTIVKDLEIHGADVSFTGGKGCTGINPSGNFSIYSSKVTARGGDYDSSGPLSAGDGIGCWGGKLTIKGDAVVKAYGGADDGYSGGHGIRAIYDIDISGNADVYAESGKDATAAIISDAGDINFSGKQLVTESTGNSAGLETGASGGGSITISAGTVTLTTANGQTIQSDANVNISKCTLSATVAAAPTVIDAGQNITIDNDVTKVDLTNSSAVGNGSTDMALLFINFTGTFKLGGTDIDTTLAPSSWSTSFVNNVITPTLTYNSSTKTLTYVP